MAPFGDTSDWRLVVTADAALRAGIGQALPGTVTEIAQRAGTDPHATRVVIDLLRAGGLVEEELGVFSATSRWPDPVLTAQLYQLARSIRLWSASVDNRLRGVVPPNGAPGHQQLDQWLASMAASAMQRAPLVADLVLQRAPRARRVLELGGGHGCYGLEFAHRGLDVVMLDRPEIIDIARDRWLRGSSVTTVAGDFFEALPEDGFDLVLCFGITHTFSGDKVAGLLSRIGSQLSEHGTVAISTFLRGVHASTAAFAMQMLAVGRGGDTHLESEYRTWLADAGLPHIEVITDGEPQVLIVAQR